MRGWKPDINSDNHRLRSKCLIPENLDIIGIAETHLYIDQNPEYTWHGQNREKHVKAKEGFGVIGFFVKND